MPMQSVREWVWPGKGGERSDYVGAQAVSGESGEIGQHQHTSSLQTRYA